jgi:MFS family permease
VTEPVLDEPPTKADAAPSGPRLETWRVALMLMPIVFISHLNRVSIATAGTARIMDQLGFSPTRMGTIYSAFLLAYTACMVPGGLLIDRFGPKAALCVVGFGSAVFVALSGVVGLTVRDGAIAFAALWVVRALMGVVSSPLHPACAAAVGAWAPPGARSRTNGFVTGAALVGIAAAPLLFGALIRAVDWPGAFLIAAGATVGLSCLWAAFAPGTAVRRDRSSSGPGGVAEWKYLLTDRSLICLAASYGAVSYFQYLFFYWVDYYFEKVLKLPEMQGRAYSAALPLAMAVGMPLGGWLGDRLEHRFGHIRARKVVPMAGLTAGGALLVLGVRAAEPAWIATWFALALLAVGMVEGAFWVTAVELGGRRGGSAAAIVNTGGNAGGMLAPVVTPWIGQLYGWGPAVGLGALVCGLGVVLWLGIKVRPGLDPDSSST